MFIYVLLLTSLYTYMLKETKDNNDTNFQKLPDMLNIESNPIQTVKPNLKGFNEFIIKWVLSRMFGSKAVNIMFRNGMDLFK